MKFAIGTSESRVRMFASLQLIRDFKRNLPEWEAAKFGLDDVG